MAMSTEQLINILEDTAELLKKTQINLKKCPKQRLTKGYIQSRIQCIEDCWKTFNNTHQELAKITPRDKRSLLPYFVNEEYFIYEDLYACILGELRDLLSNLTEQTHIKNVQELEEDKQRVHLPKIKLSIFSGMYEEWPSFKDLYISLVHDNKALSNVEKLHYLKTSISGEPAALLREIKVTEVNYLKAWEKLKNRYDNKRQIVNSLLKRLFSQKKSTAQSASQLKSILDTTSEVLDSLQNLNVSTDSWDPVIIFLLVQKLDPESHKDWENHAYRSNPGELPTWADMKIFLEGKFRTLELITPASITTRDKSLRAFHVSTIKEDKTCILCKENHTLCHCHSFIKMTPLERSDYIRNHKRCYNCLASGHSVVRCRVPMSCRICHRRHHSLLHSPKKMSATDLSETTMQPMASTSTQANVEEQLQVHTMISSYYNAKQDISLLATALITVHTEEGNTMTLKALIDPGSQACFISEKAAQHLRLKRQVTNKVVTGMEAAKVFVKHEVRVEISSRWDSNFSLPIQAYVMSKHLTIHIPPNSITREKWPHLANLNLADPEYYTAGHIDLLIDVKGYSKIIQQGIIKGPPGTPIAQKTELGWIIFGEVNIKSNTTEKCFTTMIEEIDINELLKTMWEIDTEPKRKYTKEEELCEEIYKKTYTRNNEGRYIVKLPFKTENPRSLEGNTKEIALKRFLQLERRFLKQPKLKEEYTKVIEEYKQLEHIEKIPKSEIDTKKGVYLPHHAVIRDDKESTKTRVVFDASCKGSNGVSLNDELLSGPLLQEDLRSLIIRWRTHAVCFVSDIQKMYRMILVAKEDIDFQRILWRKDPSDDIEELRLRTVTFGTASAPYLAVRTIIQLAFDEGAGYPEVVRVLREDLYMDDVMSGGDTLDEAIYLSKDLKQLLLKGGFELKKWSSNNAEFMKSIDPSDRSANAHLDLNIDGTIKALGVQWNLGMDQFEYSLNLPTQCEVVTKRSILSDIQKLFDPLGWIAPCLVMAKILIQKLWQMKVSWDEELDAVIKEEWLKIRVDLNNVNGIHIDRWLGTHKTRKHSVELHGFCDASVKAYAAVVYSRICDINGDIKISLIAAKTRVAPLKTVSLPRLELCGALLLARLLNQVRTAMRLPVPQTFAWTDSSIVIAWIEGEPIRWKAFVANRTVEITGLVPKSQWYHVRSHENPADIACRGALASELKACDMWWKGPEWLTQREIIYIQPTIIPTEIEQKKSIQTLTMIDSGVQDKCLTEQFKDFNNLEELIRSIAYCKRFLKQKSWKDNIDSPITTEELENSLHISIKKVQSKEYAEEIDSLKRNRQVKGTSTLKTLDPYLDENQILRVGGRLRHSNLTEQSKHPIILGNKNNLTPLIIADAHSKTLHGGIQLMMCHLRSKYWIIRVKGLVRQYIHRCLICAKQRATARRQVMGNLPKARVTPARPFLHSGVDFAGPLPILMSKGRGIRTQKAYITIFVCMATRAIHLELVGNMTSEAFIGAYKRFCARRGKCSHMWSDQGKSFIGANKELVAAWKEARLEFSGHIIDSLASDGTQWHFIPAYSPNFGGLWEAGVKSIKYHLKRILTTNLTYEEMSTVLCEIEACLNSRPLCPRDDLDDDSMEPLTPGHFLIGEAPITVPSPSLENQKISHLSRWQYTQKLLHDFWSRWQLEYLSRLQQRPKWIKREREFDIGDIVLIKQENLPPGKWLLGRVVDKHPGSDGFTRVYSIRSGGGTIKRSVTKLCPLPIQDDEMSHT